MSLTADGSWIRFLCDGCVLVNSLMKTPGLEAGEMVQELKCLLYNHTGWSLALSTHETSQTCHKCL